MPPKRLDPIKLMLAVAIQNHFIKGPDKPQLLPRPENVISVEASIVTPTETQVRVVTTNEGVRYFTYKLTEHI